MALRLVGGTECNWESETLQNVLATTPAEQADFVRKMVMNFSLGAKTIRESIASISELLDSEDEDPAISRQLMAQIKTLRDIGIYVTCSDLKHELSVNAHASLIDAKRFLKAAPTFKPFKHILEKGLALY